MGEKSSLKVGYIGLGLMGKAMARNILNAGFPLVVHNRSRAAVDELAAAGARAAHAPAEIAAQVDVVFTNLPDSPDVEQVTLGPDGILDGAQPGLIVVDNSTIKPATARRIAEVLGKRQVVFLDAPVSGGDIGARQGTLTIMVGGDRATLELGDAGAAGYGEVDHPYWRPGGRTDRKSRKPDHGCSPNGGHGGTFDPCPKSRRGSAKGY